MKRKTLTTAVLAGIGGVAGIANISGAVNLNPDGLGQVLIYPFYTVNGGNDTLVSVVNTTNEVKAVKVRFLESKNSREVLDFNLYLSPFDVWVGAATSTGDTGAAVLVVPDGEDSCTVPAITGPVPFTNLLLTERNAANTAFIDNSIERTREGYIEMIEMGVVEEDADLVKTGLEAAAIHTPRGTVPANCGALVAAWSTGGIWLQDEDTDVLAPTGGLFGGGSVINVFGGYQASYTADAIEGFYNPINGDASVTAAVRNTLHSQPGDTNPTLLQTDTTNQTGDPSVDRSFVFDSDRVVTSDWSRAGVPDAVTATFMRDFIYNEYAIETALLGATEWVATFPTKRFYVDPAIAGTTAINPFTNQFGVVDGIGACEFVALDFFDREEDTTFVVDEPVFSPAPVTLPNVPFLCFEAQVISFGEPGTGFFGTAPSTLLGSPNSQNIPVETEGFESGWAQIGFAPADVALGLGTAHTMTSDDGDVYNGLPVTGFSVQVVRNGTLTDEAGNNVLSNYAGLFGHRSSRDIIGS
ncbi:MAG: hypothetical protein R3348_09030 [Xanthomonadales bacterium]|nr:hypothetical protein [Xanthomonadales bacterium]